jgi:hypothetical protein
MTSVQSNGMHDLNHAGSERSSTQPRRSLVPAWELVGISVASVLAFLAFLASGPSGPIALNILAPIALGMSLGYGLLRTLQDYPAAIWFPSVWFRISAIVLYCIGSLSPYLLDEASVTYLESWISLDPATVARANLAMILGVAAAIVGMRIVPSSAAYSEDSVRSTFDGKLVRGFMIFCLAVGGAIRFGLVAPQSFGMEIWQFLTPILPLAALFQLGLLLLLIIAFRSRGWPLYVAIAILIVDTALSFLSLGKVHIISNLMMAFIASMTVRSSITRFAIWAATLAVSFYYITGVIDDARAIVGHRYTNWGTPIQRLNAIEQAILGKVDHSSFGKDFKYFDRTQSLLIRICYTHLVSIAMQYGDKGVPNLNAGYWYWPFIPRFVAPQKPHREYGREFYRMLSGVDSITTMSPTIIGDAYWNAGWTGVLAWMGLFGLVIGVWTQLTRFIIGTGRIVLLPLAFLGIWFSVVHEGFIGTAFGPFAYALYLGILLAALNYMLEWSGLVGGPERHESTDG